LVYFIGDTSHAELPDSKIEKFDLKYAEFSKTRQRSLINSINIANGINRGSDGVLKEIDRKNLNYNFNFQFNSKKNRKQQIITKNSSLGSSTRLSQDGFANADGVQSSGGDAFDVAANKEEKGAQYAKGIVEKRRNSFLNSSNHMSRNHATATANANANNIISSSYNFNNCNISSSTNNNSSNNNNNGAYHRSVHCNSNRNNSCIVEGFLINRNNAASAAANHRLGVDDSLVKGFNVNSLINLAAYGNSSLNSLDSILSLNDREPSSGIENITLTLNENSNNGYIRNNNNSKSKLITNKNTNKNNSQNVNNPNTINSDIENNYFSNNMDALNDKSRKNTSCASLAEINKDNNKQQKVLLDLPDLDKKMSLCFNEKEAANKKAKNNSKNNLELLNCLKQKELEIMNAHQTFERKEEGKMMLSKILFIT